MPYPNEHAARMKDPSLFQKDSFRRKNITSGIDIIIGRLKGQDTTTTQAYRFDKDKYTAEQARKWLKDHNIKPILFEKAIEAFSDTIKVNSTGLKNAKSLIGQGKIDNTSQWSFETADKNKILGPDENWNEFSKWHLAIDTQYEKDTRQYYRYPFGKNGKVYRSALRAIRSRSGQQNQTNILNAAGKLFDQLREKVQAFCIKLINKRLFAFSQNEIISNIPEKILNKIKEKDPHPFFTMYSICHTGESSPVVIGEGSKKISWPERAIQSMKNIIMRGIKFFRGHNKDNSHSGRKVLGKVIHSFQKEIEGKLHQLVIGYHPPDVREDIKELDVCSQESEWFIFGQAGKLIADTIKKMTGIALGNSKEEMPAFSGAKRLGYIQAFESSGEDENNNLGEDNMPGEGKTNDSTGKDTVVKTQKTNNFQVQYGKADEITLTFDEFVKLIQKEINSKRIYPSQFLSKDDLQRDNEFGVLFNELNLLKEDNEKKAKKLKEFERASNLSTATKQIDKLLKDSKTPKEISQFITKKFEKEKNKIDDLSEKALQDYIAEKTEDFQFAAKIANPDFDINQVDGDNKGVGGDLTKAENNELLEEDYVE